MTRKTNSDFRWHLEEVSSAASKKRAVLEKKGAKCGNCKHFSNGKCILKKKIVQPYNYCEHWK